MPDAIPVGSINKILSAAQAAGVNPEELANVANLDLRLLDEPDNRIPFAQLVGLYQHGARLTGDDAFGLHVGERDSPKLYGILGYITINSSTVGEALNRLLRFQQIRTSAYKFSLDIDNATTHLTYLYQGNEVSPQERRHESEETLCSIIQFGRLMTGFDWVPLEVRFEHARPADVSEHKRIFRAPLRFLKVVTELVFDTSFLARPVVEADLTLGALLEQQADELLVSTTNHENDFVNKVRQLIRESLNNGGVQLETIGRKLGTSSRTLQRRLDEEGTSFQKLLEETQSELSRFYLQQPDVAICEISHRLGFSKPSAFHRAFRRWTGETPLQFAKVKNIDQRSRNPKWTWLFRMAYK